MTFKPARHDLFARLLHWSMAALILTMLFIGVAMVSSVSLRPALLELHRPIGIASLLLAVVRLLHRLRHEVPALPENLPAPQIVAAHASHLALYGLMLAMPLVGWAMVSAAGNPVILWGDLHLPSIVPHDPELYSRLRSAHTWFARGLLLVILMHVAGALYHAWVRRDQVFRSMALFALSRRPQGSQISPTSAGVDEPAADASVLSARPDGIKRD